jgi:hypothetical protein
MRRKGELSPAMVDRDWPHQVAVPAQLCLAPNTAVIHEFCKELSLCPRGHSVMWQDKWYQVFCFKDPAHAARFMAVRRRAVRCPPARPWTQMGALEEVTLVARIRMGRAINPLPSLPRKRGREGRGLLIAKPIDLPVGNRMGFAKGLNPSYKVRSLNYAAIRFTLLSATAVSFLSAAFSSSRFCCSSAAQSLRPSCLAQAIRLP